MTIKQALKSGKFARRPITKFKGSSGEGWIDLNYWYEEYLNRNNGKFDNLVSSYISLVGFTIDREDIIAKDWEIKEEKTKFKNQKSVTTTKFKKTFKRRKRK